MYMDMARSLSERPYVSVRVMTAVWELELPHTEKLVLLALADNANDEGDCWPSITTISRKCGMHRATVMRSITELENRRLVVRSGEAGKTNSYRLHPSQPATSSAQQPVAHDDGGSRTARLVPVAESDPTRRSLRPRTIIEPSFEPSLNRQKEALSADFGDFLQSTYPECDGKRSWTTATHNAGILVESGRATEVQLRAAVEGYRAHRGHEGGKGAYSPQNFFALVGEDLPWQRVWKPPKSKAQVVQDSNVAASMEWLGRDNAAAG